MRAGLRRLGCRIQRVRLDDRIASGTLADRAIAHHAIAVDALHRGRNGIATVYQILSECAEPVGPGLKDRRALFGGRLYATRVHQQEIRHCRSSPLSAHYTDFATALDPPRSASIICSMAFTWYDIPFVSHRSGHICLAAVQRAIPGNTPSRHAVVVLRSAGELGSPSSGKTNYN
jgi:hypothetical protein